MSYQSSGAAHGNQPGHHAGQRQSSSQTGHPSRATQSGQPLRSSDNLRRELPPLQPVPDRNAGSLGGVHAILNPSTTSPSCFQQTPQTGSSGSQTFGQHQPYQPVLERGDAQRVTLPPVNPYGSNQVAGQWSAGPAPYAPASAQSSGPYGSYTPQPTSAPVYSSQSAPTGEPVSITQWRATQDRRESSTGSSDRPAASSATRREPPFYVLETEQGPVNVPLNIHTASRAANEKRKKNAGASARFRQRRKEKEQASTQAIDVLTKKYEECQEELEFYRQERDIMARVLYNGPDRDRLFPRPPSPRNRRAPSEQTELSQSSSPASSTAYQENISRQPGVTPGPQAQGQHGYPQNYSQPGAYGQPGVQYQSTAYQQSQQSLYSQQPRQYPGHQQNFAPQQEQRSGSFQGGQYPASLPERTYPPQQPSLGHGWPPSDQRPR